METRKYCDVRSFVVARAFFMQIFQFVTGFRHRKTKEIYAGWDSSLNLV